MYLKNSELACCLSYTTKEFKIPTAKTSKNQIPKPENTVPLFSNHAFGDAKITGTPTTSRNDTTINAKSVNWKIRSIYESLLCAFLCRIYFDILCYYIYIYVTIKFSNKNTFRITMIFINKKKLSFV